MNVVIRNGFDLTQQGRFIDLMKKYKPSLVIIDSLVGCSGARAADENKSIYARPLYWITRNNGVTYPATTVMIIHHSNKQGGFRAPRLSVTQSMRYGHSASSLTRSKS